MQVCLARPSLLWPHQSHCWWMGSHRRWSSAWSSMSHPLVLTALYGSQAAMAVRWMPSPTVLPQQQMAPGLVWPSCPCPLRSWQPGNPWSATLGLGPGARAKAHSPYSCQVGMESGFLRMLLVPFHTSWSQMGGRAGSKSWKNKGFSSGNPPGLGSGQTDLIVVSPGVCHISNPGSAA